MKIVKIYTYSNHLTILMVLKLIKLSFIERVKMEAVVNTRLILKAGVKSRIFFYMAFD